MSNKKSGVGKFIAGAAIGAGVALLFAPQEGSKTRKQLKKKIDELVEKVKNIDIVEVKENIEDKIAEIKADLQDLDGEKVLEFAKDKGRKIAKKADELVKYAVAKGTPVVQKLAEDIRVKTIEVLEETIKKLEKKAPEKVTSKVNSAKKATSKKVSKK